MSHNLKVKTEIHPVALRRGSQQSDEITLFKSTPAEKISGEEAKEENGL
jgi:hypothetical protein